VKVEVDGGQGIFKPEMLVDVTFLAPKPADSAGEASENLHLYVPQQSILHDDSGTFVWLADQSAGRAVKTPVAAGTIAPGGLQEITQGLSISSHLITRGQENLKDRERIQVVGEETTAAAVATTSAESSQPLRRLPEGANSHGTH
jgi:hypothetical protein